MNQHTNLTKKPYQAIFFDLDGTLTDPKKGITGSIQFALEKMGLSAPPGDMLVWCIGEPLKEIFAKLLNTSCEALLIAALSFYREHFTNKGMYENFLYPDVPLMLENLIQENYRLFIATSKPEIFAVKILKHFGLAHYFEKIYGSELDGTRSDKSHLVKYIMENNSINNPSVMVGDRKFDVIAALDNELIPLGVTYGYGSIKELNDAGAFHLCHSPKEVYKWIIKT
ncbi:MAG: HAD hydrolase-like protein [Parachlamydiaceae bacterium]|nr:HAD hydrolase-like protein [Parachlamydiaceae bacterium]